MAGATKACRWSMRVLRVCNIAVNEGTSDGPHVLSLVTVSPTVVSAKVDNGAYRPLKFGWLNQTASNEPIGRVA